MGRFVSHCLIKYMPYSWSDKTNIVVVFFRWSLSGNMSWQDQSLRQAFFALDPSRALKEFDSAIIYLAFYFRFIKKQAELWHEGQGLACQVNEPMHLSVYCTTLSNQIQLLFQSALQKISTCSELKHDWMLCCSCCSRLLSLNQVYQCWTTVPQCEQPIVQSCFNQPWTVIIFCHM